MPKVDPFVWRCPLLAELGYESQNALGLTVTDEDQLDAIFVVLFGMNIFKGHFPINRAVAYQQ